MDKEEMPMSDTKRIEVHDETISKKFLYIFSGAWSVASMIYLACITFITIPEQNVRFADTILGFMVGVVISTMFNFYYGSSKSSQAKDNAINTFIRESNRGER